MRFTRFGLMAAFLCFGTPLPSFGSEPIDYVKQIQPILQRHCYECHNDKVQKAGLRLDTVAALRKSSDSGKLIVPHKAEKSILFVVLDENEFVRRMPYRRSPLKKTEIQLIETWIDQGAKFPAKDQVVRVEDHWSFRPPVRSKLPAIENTKWVRNPIDAFILARLEERGIRPSPEADKVTLLRRVYLDLIGLPPTPDQVANFLSDSSDRAYEKVVDQLLASPHYGERWGRHWLDVARYADSHGFTIDAPRQIWKYRDWVIDALNQDMPFDQFVIEQFAGDMLPKATISQKIATGFHRNTLINQEGGVDKEQFRVEAVADRVNTTGTVFLGLTLECSRCHDHKYDPIQQKEYFQLFAFLNNQNEPKLTVAAPPVAAKREKMEKQVAKLEVELNNTIAEYLKTNAKVKDALKENLSMILRLRPDQRTSSQKRALASFFRGKTKGLRKRFDQINRLNKTMPRFPTTLVLEELSRPRKTTVHIKGDFTRPGETVVPAVPAVLHPLKTPKRKRANRLDLANWLVDSRNPLVGRVTVNRLWQRHFGRGIVATENDFGTQGARPTHPELLDWLATEFVRQQWSLKAMHKLIVMSSTYRQSSKARPEVAKVDPYNKLLARQKRLRLDAEIIRDNALAVAGLLAKKIGGPSVYPPQPNGIYNFTQVRRSWSTSIGENRFRRGMYTFFQRSAPYPPLVVFDAPDGTKSCTRRVQSNTPLQALTLLNDQAYMEIAGALALRVWKDAPKTTSERVRHAFRLCLAREPSSWEAERIERFVDLQTQEFAKSHKETTALLKTARIDSRGLTEDSPDLAAWVATSRVLLNLDEFITRE
ncbi:MAG: PSD1 and planctomycete cytochrome C domain-containing protein [Gemmataceae bacterium]